LRRRFGVSAKADVTWAGEQIESRKPLAGIIPWTAFLLVVPHKHERRRDQRRRFAKLKRSFQMLSESSLRRSPHQGNTGGASAIISWRRAALVLDGVERAWGRVA
jgi:hypothetical protein